MQLLDKLKNYTLKDAIEIESKDRQFLALKKLYENKQFPDNLYLFLIIANALISFQLSGKGEDYWEEFSNKGMSDDSFGRLSEDLRDNIGFVRGLSDGRTYHQKSYLNHVNSLIYTFFENLLKNGKNNRRFVDMKLKRAKKFLDGWGLMDKDLDGGKNDLDGGKLDLWEKYYKNMNLLAEDLAKIMGQSKDAKTIVFAVKMFSYGARNVFGYLEYFPFDLMIPIDSRLENLYKKFQGKKKFTKKDVKDFYSTLSKQLNIPPLHLDAILWVNYDRFIND